MNLGNYTFSDFYQHCFETFRPHKYVIYKKCKKNHVLGRMDSLNESGANVPGKPLLDTSVKLLNRKCGLNTSVSRNEIADSDAPTTTIRKLIAT